jgi:hypothetical protein
MANWQCKEEESIEKLSKKKSGTWKHRFLRRRALAWVAKPAEPLDDLIVSLD